MAYGTFAFGKKAGMLTPDSVNSLKNAISGLNAEQAALALSTRGLTTAQQNQVLVEAGLVASSDRISASFVKQALLTDGLDKEQQESILIKAGLMHEDSKLLLSGEAVSAQRLKQILIENGYQEEQAETLINSILQEGQNYKEALSWKVLGTKAKETAIAMLHNPLTWIVTAIASVGLLVKGYDALIGKQEKISRQKIEGLDEDISKLDEEIKTLEELQSKLEDAKGSRYELSQIQTELNDAIGETKGLLNGESKAWDVANAKLKANIELKKQQRKQAQQDRVDESKDLYDSNSMEIDWRMDLSGDKAREYAEALSWMNGKSFDEFYGSDEYNKLTNQQQSLLWEAVGFKNSYTEEWSNYWKEQIDTAYDVFEETISNYDGAGGQDFIKGLISDMVQDGASLSEISDVVTQVINNQDMQDAINKYWESLVNPDIDSEEALQAVKKIFDDIVAKNPALKDFFDNFYNGIVAGGKAATDTGSDVNKMTDSLEALNKSLDNLQSAYKTVEDAIKEYNSTGMLSVDTLQALSELEPEYLGYLMDENGNLSLNSEAMRKYTEALIDNLAQKQVSSLLTYIAGLSKEERQLYLTTGATEEATSGMFDLTTAMLAAGIAAGELSEEELGGITNMVNGIFSWAESAKKGLSKGGLSGSVEGVNEKLDELNKKDKLEDLEYGIDKVSQAIERLDDSLAGVNFALDQTFEGNFAARISLVAKQLSLTQDKGAKLRAEFERLCQIQPQTADEANAIADRMAELGEEMRDNQASAIEYSKTLIQLRVDGIVSLGEAVGETISQINESIDRNLETLKTGGLRGLHLDLLPSIPENALEKQQKENEQLIEEQEKFNDEIARIRRKALDLQHEENKKANQKERDELVSSLTEARGIINEHYDTVETDTADFVKNTNKTYQDFLDLLGQAPEPDEAGWKNWWETVKKYADKFENEIVKSNISTAPESLTNNTAKNTGFINPIANGRITDTYADHVKRGSAGLDIAAPLGTPMYSICSGSVEKVTYDARSGHYVVVVSDDGRYRIGYMHMDSSPAWKPGDKINMGDLIGPVGKTGKNVTGPHLHIQVQQKTNNGWTHIDPKKVIPGYAFGTSSHPGGVALVGDRPHGRGTSGINPEIARYPDGTLDVLGTHGAEFVDLPKGTEIIPTNETKKILSRSTHSGSSPYYAAGTEISEEKTEEQTKTWEEKLDAILAEYKATSKYSNENSADALDEMISIENSINSGIASREQIDKFMVGQVEYNSATAQSQLAIAKATYENLLKLYQEAVDADASPDELNTIREGIASFGEVLRGVSEDYASSWDSYAEYRVSQAEREMSVYDEKIAALDKERENIERILDKTTDISDSYDLLGDAIENSESKIATYNEEIWNADLKAHQAYMRDEYAPIREAGFNEQYVSGWFNTDDAGFTAKYYEDIERLSASDYTAWIVPMIQAFAKETQVHKKEQIEAVNGKLEEEERIREDINEQTEIYRDTLLDIAEHEGKTLQFRYDKENAIIGALEKQNDLHKQIRDTRAQINADLDASKHMAEWLDEDTRKLLFNEEDYSVLNSELNKIDKNITRLYRNYRAEINNLSSDEWYKEAEITSQFEARLEVQMEAYKLTEKELEVAKKRTEYENIAKQRNTRVMVAGQWRQIADPEQLYEASKSLATLESEKSNMEITNAENAIVRDMQAVNNATNTSRLAIENFSQMIQDLTPEDMAEFAERYLPNINVLEGMLTVFEGANWNIIKDAYPMLANFLGGFTGLEMGTHVSPTVDYEETMNNMWNKDNYSTQERIIGNSVNKTRNGKINFFDRSESRHAYYGESQADNAQKITAINNDGMPVYEPLTQEELYAMCGGLPANMEMVDNQSLSIAEMVKPVFTGVADFVANITKLKDTEHNIINHFNGDIVLTETIEDGDQFTMSLMKATNTKFDTTKNMKL